MTVLKLTARFFFWLLLAGLAAWGALALHFDLPWARRDFAAAAFVLWMLLVPVLVRKKRLAVLVLVLTYWGLLSWWFSLEPSNQRVWEPNVARLAYATFQGRQVTVHNIRNFNYRSGTNFDADYYDRTFNLSHLKGVDLFISYWGPSAFAHSTLSFQFDDGEPLAISIEVRRELGEEFSQLKSFFRRYEMIYIIADERDIIRLRSNYWRHKVYLYHLAVSPAQARVIFLEYLGRANRLVRQPEFFNSFSNNCTLSLFWHGALNLPIFDSFYQGLFPGYLDQELYRTGNLRSRDSLPFEEFKRRSLINPAAEAADQEPDFSERIRANLPP